EVTDDDYTAREGTSGAACPPIRDRDHRGRPPGMGDQPRPHWRRTRRLAGHPGGGGAHCPEPGRSARPAGSTRTRKAASRVRGSVEGLAYSSVLDGDRSCCRRRGDPHGRHRCPTRGAHAQPRIVGQPALAGTAVNLEEFARLTAPRTTRDTPLANDGDPLARRHWVPLSSATLCRATRPVAHVPCSVVAELSST